MKVQKFCSFDVTVLCCLQILTSMKSFGPLPEKAFFFYYGQWCFTLYKDKGKQLSCIWETLPHIWGSDRLILLVLHCLWSSEAYRNQHRFFSSSFTFHFPPVSQPQSISIPRDHSFADWPYLLSFLLAVSAFLRAGLADCKQMRCSVCGLECPILKGNHVIILGFRTEELVLNQSSWLLS